MRTAAAKHRSELALSLKILIPTALMFVLFVYFSNFVALPLVEFYMMKQKRQTLRNISSAAWHLVDQYNQMAASGDLSELDARTQALAAIRNLRYGEADRNYFWIFDHDSVLLMHPLESEMEGSRLTQHPEKKVRVAFAEAMEKVERSGEGFIDYLWQRGDAPDAVMAKLAYIKPYEPWGWLLGTGLYVADVHDEVDTLTRRLVLILLGVVVASMVFCFYIYQQAAAVQARRRRAEAINRVLIQISNAVNTTFDLDALYHSIHQSLGEIIDVSNFFIAQYDAKANIISFPYYCDEVDKVYPLIEGVQYSSSLTARVILTARPVFSTREQTLAWADRLGKPPVGTPAELWLGVPLKTKGEVIGVMATQSYSRGDHFDETDLEVFVSVSDQVALAIERKSHEMTMKEAKDALEASVQERTEALVKINTRLENEIRQHERTEQILRESEERLIRSERLAATGQLAASIAHEINSPLQGVTSLINVMNRKYDSVEGLTGDLDLIKGAFGSIRNTVKNLLDLNRPGKEKNQPVRLEEIIGQTAMLVKGYLKDHGVQLTLDLQPDLPVIMGSPQQLGQVFMNLINNAVEAINSVVQVESRQIRIKASVSDNQIVIEVSDTGPGISKEDMARIFDAFFTSKKKMGMGVGLSICHRIIEDHNGTISVSNRPDGGAVFSIRFPRLR